MRLALVVEYEGTRYHGFQYQTNAPSVQAELEVAIARLTGEESRVKGAGRTDAGVHAKGQVVAFDTSAVHTPQTFVRALNFYLPDDIVIKRAYIVDSDFDPRRMARSRRYGYTIDCGATPSPLTRRTAYHVGAPLNVRRMRTAAAYFLGRHDFARFGGLPSGPNASTVREVFKAKVRQHLNFVNFEVEGNSFLPHQVRRMAGALVDVGRGSLTLTEFKSLIAGGAGDMVAHSLPPHGLCLLEVTYSDFQPKIGESDDRTR